MFCNKPLFECQMNCHRHRRGWELLEQSINDFWAEAQRCVVFSCLRQRSLDVTVNVSSVSNADDSYNQSRVLDFVDNRKVAFANPV